MAHGQETERAPTGGQNPRPSQVDTAPVQTERGPDGPDRDRQIAQEPQQSTGVGSGQS